METISQAVTRKFLIVILFLFLVSLFFSFSRMKSKTIVQVSPLATPATEANYKTMRTLSSVALEPSFLTLEDNLKKLEKDLVEVDLAEPKLALPILEMNVNFEK